MIYSHGFEHLAQHRSCLRRTARLCLALTSTALLVTSNGLAVAQTASGDPTNVTYAVEIAKDGSLGKLSTATIPAQAFSSGPNDPTPKPVEAQPSTPSRLQAALEQRLSTGNPTDRVSIIVTLREDLTVPRLPDLPYGETRDSAVGRDLGRQQDLLIDQLRDARQQSQTALVARLQEQSKVVVQEQFWLINGFLADAPLGAIKDILNAPEVQFIQLREAGESPPMDGNQLNDVADARARIQSDPYFNLPNMALGYAALLDTGVRATHTTFAAPNNHLDYLRDCVQGGPDCNATTNPGYNPDDSCWNHGTSSASIFTGNANQGFDFRGVTAMTVDSWQIYNCPPRGLDAAAAVRGFQAGLRAFDRIFIAEIQASEPENGAIAMAADNAFDAGGVVIAANGNFGPNPGTVASPAIAHKAIGVGEYRVETLATPSEQSRGPATDARFKPDLQAPSYTETASSASSTAQRVFGGTSGATPYAAGAAALTRNWMRSYGLIEPGHVYARMILSGQRSWPYDTEEGAGDLMMQTCGLTAWGKIYLTASGSTIDIPFGVTPNRTSFDAALWWPERLTEIHDDVDLYLIDPSGVERARGYSMVSIFERARAAMSPMPGGTWRLRIRAASIVSGPQPVYWAASVQGC